MPLGGETGLDVGRLVAGPRQIPQQQAVVEIVADKAVAFEPLIGIAGGDRQVASGHADSESAGGLRCDGAEPDAQAGGERRSQMRSILRHMSISLSVTACRFAVPSRLILPAPPA